MTTKASSASVTEWMSISKKQDFRTPKRIDGVNAVGRKLANALDIGIVDSFAISKDRIEEICDGTHFACTMSRDCNSETDCSNTDCSTCDPVFYHNHKGHVHGAVVFNEVELLLNVMFQEQK
jgi:hypothetical protein